jgi:hypothetical protein
MTGAGQRQGHAGQQGKQQGSSLGWNMMVSPLGIDVPSYVLSFHEVPQ